MLGEKSANYEQCATFYQSMIVSSSLASKDQKYWYHWEIWREGDRLLKKSKYIPKRLVAKVEKMEKEKISVREILKVLTSEDCKS